MLNLLYSNTNQDVVEKQLCNQGSHYEKHGRFPLCKESHYAKKPLHATTKLTLFAVSKDEWNTNE